VAWIPEAQLGWLLTEALELLSTFGRMWILPKCRGTGFLVTAVSLHLSEATW
jgi:hypothetical protein